MEDLREAHDAVEVDRGDEQAGRAGRGDGLPGVPHGSHWLPELKEK